MREIIFRGKRKDNGKWIYGSIYFVKYSVYIIDKTNPHLELIEVDVETVGQYSGMVDKNEGKIFEGDIIKIWDTFMSQYQYEECYFRYNKFFIGCLENNNSSDMCEIVGNISDNPELVSNK